MGDILWVCNIQNYEFMENAKIGCDCMLSKMYLMFSIEMLLFDIFINTINRNQNQNQNQFCASASLHSVLFPQRWSGGAVECSVNLKSMHEMLNAYETVATKVVSRFVL